MTTSLGARIRQARLAQYMSQQDLADAAKVSQPTVANWEKGSHIPRQAALLRLANILNTSSRWFLVGDDSLGNTQTAPAQYLSMPIHHIGFHPWPVSADITPLIANKDTAHAPLNLGVPSDYIAVSVMAQRPFALIANDPQMAGRFPIGTAIIFDGVPGPLLPAKYYLFAHGNDIVVRRWNDGPSRLETRPARARIDMTLANKGTRPLARVLLSMRRH